jgi:ParB family chromosome partitioning protein
MSNDSLQKLPINQLQPNPFQPRSKMIKEDLDELVQSIKAYGILEPLVVAQTPAGFQIIAGERRWRAAKEAGLEEVPVHIKKTTPKGMLEMALVENVQRVDLSGLERAAAFQQLMRDFKFGVSDLSEKIGKSPSYISNTLKLLDLPDAIKDGLVGGQITEGHARALSGIPDERDMVACYKIILKENGSVRRAEELSRRYRDKHVKEDEVGSLRGRPVHLDDQLLNQWKKNFKQVFNAKSDFKVVRSNRNTRITLTLKGTPEETQADLEKVLSWGNVEVE